EALRRYGIDKPDMRLPAMTEVRDAFAPENLASLSIDPSLPVVAVVIPNVGELSRKERDDLRTLYPAKLAQQGIKVFDDSKRLEKSFPEAMAKIREQCGAGEKDYVVIVAAGAVAEGAAKSSKATDASSSVVTGREREVYEGAGLVRLALAQKFA